MTVRPSKTAHITAQVDEFYATSKLYNVCTTYFAKTKDRFSLPLIRHQAPAALLIKGTAHERTALHDTRSIAHIGKDCGTVLDDIIVARPSLVVATQVGQ